MPNSSNTTPISQEDYESLNKEINPSIIRGKITKTNKQINKIRIVQLFFFVGLFVINIIHFTINSSYTELSKALFQINIYAYLLSSDILYVSLACERTWMIFYQFQTGSIDFYQKKIYEHSAQMLSHLQSIQTDVKLIKDKKKVEEIYKILLEVNTYHIMLPNWSLSIKNASLLEEIYYLHYSLSLFNFNSDAYKAIDRDANHIRNQIRKLAPSEKEETDAFYEDIVVFYIQTNVISTISILIMQLTEVTRNQLNDYSDESSNKMFVCNILLLVIAFCSFTFQIIYTFKVKYTYENMIKRFFYKDIREDEFNQDVNRLRRLIMNFGKKECEVFESKSLKQQTPQHKTFHSTILIPHYSTEYKPISRDNVLIARQSKNNAQFDKESNNDSDPSSPSKLNRKKEIDKRKNNNNHTNKPNKRVFNQIGEEIRDGSNLIVDAFKSELNKLIKSKFMIVFLIMLFFLFLAFTFFQLGSLCVSSKSALEIKEGNLITVYYLLRIPKLAELIFYSQIAVITNNQLPVDSNTINFSLDNLYNISGDTENSLLNSLENKYYIELNKQLALIRGNIRQLSNDPKRVGMIPRIKRIDQSFQGEDFCLSIGKESMIAQLDNQIDTLVEFFRRASQESTQCRIIGNEINLGGMNIVLDYLTQNLNVLYYDYEKNLDYSMFKYLSSDILQLIVDEIQTTFSSVNIVFAYNIIKDMEDNYNGRKTIEFLFSIVSLIFSCGSILLLEVIIKFTFTKYTIILDMFWIKYEKALKFKGINNKNYNDSINY